MPIPKETFDNVRSIAFARVEELGGTVIAFSIPGIPEHNNTEGVVLWQRDQEQDPYVVHYVRENTGLFVGGYHATYEEAEKDFKEREAKLKSGAASDEITAEAEEAAEVAEDAAEAVAEHEDEIADEIAEEVAEPIAEDIVEVAEEAAEVAEEAAEDAAEAEENDDGAAEAEAAEEAILAAEVAAEIAVEALPPEDVPPKVSHWWYKERKRA